MCFTGQNDKQYLFMVQCSFNWLTNYHDFYTFWRLGGLFCVCLMCVWGDYCIHACLPLIVHLPVFWKAEINKAKIGFLLYNQVFVFFPEPHICFFFPLKELYFLFTF